MFQLSLNEKLRLIALQWSTSNSEADDYSENVDGLEIVFFFSIAAQMEKTQSRGGLYLMRHFQRQRITTLSLLKFIIIIEKIQTAKHRVLMKCSFNLNS